MLCMFRWLCRTPNDLGHPRLQMRCSQEALTPHRPQPSSASLAALLNHPDSGGVFQLHQDVRRGISSSTFSVDLVDERLRRMAARGLAEAVAAAWPEDGPLPRLRRAAAVAMACEYDSMPGTPSGSRHVSGEVLAGRLREQLRGQAVPHPGVLPRRLAEGDETELFAVEMRKAVSAGLCSRWQVGGPEKSRMCRVSNELLLSALAT